MNSLKTDVTRIQLPVSPIFLVIGVNSALFAFAVGLLRSGVPIERICIVFDKDRRPDYIPELSLVRKIEVSASSPNELLAAAKEVNASVCCVFGWYAIFSQEFIDTFDGLVFNMHFGDLPQYRGAGGFSWQVLNGHKRLGAFIHVMTKKVDAGCVVCSSVATVENQEPYPIDYIRASDILAKSVAQQFALEIAKNHFLNAYPQDEELAEYFPKLLTFENGVIDFSWSAEDVYCFIRAFSDPYPGAIFRYNEKKYHVTKASFINSKISRHPYCCGLIVNKSNGSLHIIFADGILKFESIKDAELNSVDMSIFRIGGRLYNSNADIQASQLYRS